MRNTRIDAIRATVACVVILAVGGHAAAKDTPIMTCPFVISAPGNYFLAANLGPCAGPFAIQIATSDVRLRLEGHAITGVATLATDGISADGVQKIRIEGPGTIISCRFGIHWQNVDNSQVREVTAARNQSGFVISGGSDNRFTENAASDNTAIGYFLDGATNSRLEDNAAINNAVQGIALISGGGHKLTGNTANGNGFDVDCAGGFDGIVVASSGNDLEGNRANGNCTDGIGIFSGSGNRVVENTTLGNRLGIGLFAGSTENRVVENTALGNNFFDLADFNPNCDANHWVENNFVSSNQGCIH